jgi:response regulator NasT
MTSARLVIALDPPEVRLQMRLMLEALNHQIVAEAGDAATGWRLARHLQSDLLLLDISLDDAKGFERAEGLRTAASPPILFASESAAPALLDRARRAGCAGFLLLPCTAEALEVAVCMALDRHAERAALQRELSLLKEKLEARKLINRAKAILMERHGLSEPEAFRRLQTQSMSTATPMKALAEAIILSSQVLEGEAKRRTAA